MAKLKWVNQTSVTLQRIVRAGGTTSIDALPLGATEIEAPPETMSIGVVTGQIPPEGCVELVLAPPPGYAAVLFVFPVIPQGDEEILKSIANS